MAIYCFDNLSTNLLPMQYLQGEGFHFAVERLVIKHECWFILQDLMNDQGGLARLFTSVAV